MGSINPNSVQLKSRSRPNSSEDVSSAPDAVTVDKDKLFEWIKSTLPAEDAKLFDITNLQATLKNGHILCKLSDLISTLQSRDVTASRIDFVGLLSPTVQTGECNQRFRYHQNQSREIQIHAYGKYP